MPYTEMATLMYESLYKTVEIVDDEDIVYRADVKCFESDDDNDGEGALIFFTDEENRNICLSEHEIKSIKLL